MCKLSHILSVTELLTCRALNKFISTCRVQGLRFLSHKFKAFFTKIQRKVFLIISRKLAVWN